MLVKNLYMVLASAIGLWFVIRDGLPLLYTFIRILFGSKVLLLAKFFRHKLHVFWSKYVCKGVCEFPLLSKNNPSKSCHGYCLTPHVH